MAAKSEESSAGWKGCISELELHFFLRTLFSFFFALASSSYTKICPCEEASVIEGDNFFFF